MFKVIRRIFSIFLYVFCAIVLTISVYSMVQRVMGVQQPMVFGWGAAVVQTGSMEPNVPVGTLIIIHEQDSYEVGDVVTYIDYRDWSITHRIIAIGNGQVVTQGDANSIADPVFSEDAIVGKMQYMFVGVGTVFEFIQKPIVAISLFGLLLFVFVWDMIVAGKKKKQLVRMFAVAKSNPYAPQNSEQPNLSKMFSVRK